MHNKSGGSNIQLECGPMPNVMAAVPNIKSNLFEAENMNDKNK